MSDESRLREELDKLEKSLSIAKSYWGAWEDEVQRLLSIQTEKEDELRKYLDAK